MFSRLCRIMVIFISYQHYLLVYFNLSHGFSFARFKNIYFLISYVLAVNDILQMYYNSIRYIDKIMLKWLLGTKYWCTVFHPVFYGKYEIHGSTKPYSIFPAIARRVDIPKMKPNYRKNAQLFSLFSESEQLEYLLIW